MNPDGSQNKRIMNTNLFANLDQPVVVGTLSVRADKPTPEYEISEFNNRFAIIVFSEGMPECNVDIQVSS